MPENMLEQNYFNINYQYLCVKFIVTQVKGGVDGLKGLKIDVHSLLLSIISQNGTTVQDKTIVGHSIVQLQLLLCGCDSTEHRQSEPKSNTLSRDQMILPIDSRLNV